MATQHNHRPTFITFVFGAGQTIDGASIAAAVSAATAAQAAAAPPAAQPTAAQCAAPPAAGQAAAQRTATQGAAAQPVADQRAAQPVAAQRAAQPVAAQRAAQPVAAQRVAQPVAAQRADQPVAAQPVAQRVAAQPVAQRVAAQLAAQPVAAPPIGRAIKTTARMRIYAPLGAPPRAPGARPVPVPLHLRQVGYCFCGAHGILYPEYGKPACRNCKQKFYDADRFVRRGGAVCRPHCGNPTFCHLHRLRNLELLGMRRDLITHRK